MAEALLQLLADTDLEIADDIRVEPGSIALIEADDEKLSEVADALRGQKRLPAAALLWLGAPIGTEPPLARRRRGLAFTPRAVAVPAVASVVEAALVYLVLNEPLRLRHFWRLKPTPEQRERAAELVRFVGLNQTAAMPTGALQPAINARLALLQALAARPRVLVCDRLGEGLDPTARNALATRTLSLTTGGIAVLWLDAPTEVPQAIQDAI